MDRLSNYHQFTENYILDNNSSETLNPVRYPNNSLQLQYNSTLDDFKRQNKLTPLMSVKYLFLLIIFKDINKL